MFTKKNDSFLPIFKQNGPWGNFDPNNDRPKKNSQRSRF